MEKSKVLRFQICCARTKYLSETYKNQTLIVGTTKPIRLGLERLSAKNWVQFGSSDF